MIARNKVLGNAICAQVEELIRGWGYRVHSYEDDPGEAPGDFVVGNGNGTRLFVECKGYSVLTSYGPHHRKTYPSRPLLTSTRHEWLRDEGGIYVFASYRLEDAEPIVAGMRFAPARAIRVPANQWRLPWARLGEMDELTASRIHRLLMPP